MLFFTLACDPWGPPPEDDEVEIPAPLGVYLSPDNLSFSTSVLELGSEVKSFQVINASDESVTLIGQADIDGNVAFSVEGTPAFAVLEPDATLTVSVRFTPLADQSHSAIIQINEDLVVSLSGSGLAPQISQPAVEDTTAPTGCTAETFLNLGNAGHESLIIENIETEDLGDFTLNEPLPDTLEPGAEALISVTFQPTAEGQRLGLIRFGHNDPGKQTTYNVQFEGEGLPGDTVEQVFHYGAGGGTSVLILLDEQGGGLAYQDQVLAGLTPLVEALDNRGISYRIAGPSTADGCPVGAPAYATYGDDLDDIIGVLQSGLFDAGVGDYADRLIELSRVSLGESGAGCLAGFVQSHQATHVVLISDREDESESGWETEYAAAQLYAEGGLAYSAIIPVSGCATTPPSYANIAIASGGKTFDLCQSDWSPFYDEIADLTAELEGGDVSWPLSEAPVPNTVQVTVNGVTSQDWTLDTEEWVLAISGPIAEGAEVRATYTPASSCD